MGWYTAWELDFEQPIEWDDKLVDHTLGDMTYSILFLHDFETNRAILNLYSHHSIKEVLRKLYGLFGVPILYRLYQSDSWASFKGSS